MDIVDIVDRMLECYSLQVSLQITKTLLQELEQKKLINFLEDLQIESKFIVECSHLQAHNTVFPQQNMWKDVLNMYYLTLIWVVGAYLRPTCS